MTCSEHHNKRCTCPHGERSLGKLHGVMMGRGIVRLDTADDCPIHELSPRQVAQRARQQAKKETEE